MDFFDSSEIRTRLTAWFARNLPGSTNTDITAVARLSTGNSNDTFAVDVSWRHEGKEESQAFVLRTRPEGVGLLEPYDVGKQFRVMKALEGSQVPVPLMYWLEDDETVIGKPFFVMEKLDGVILEQELPESVLYADPAKIRRLCERYVETIAAIHKIDWRGRGLGFLGDGTGFIEREIAWWEGEIRRFQQGPLPSFDRVIAWLKANNPVQTPQITLVHGDCKWGNLLLQDETVVAMFDWEMTAVGDPMTDIGWCTWLWDSSAVAGGIPSLPGAMTKEQLLAYYEQLTGIVVHDIRFYEALEGFKMAAILFVGSMLFESGQSNDLRYLTFGALLPQHLQRLLGTIGVVGSVEHGKVTSSGDRILAAAAETVKRLILPELASHQARSQALALLRLIGMFSMGFTPSPSAVASASPEEESARGLASR